MTTLAKELIQLESLIEHAKKINPSISTRGVDWHIDHSLICIIKIATALETSSPEDYKPNLNLSRLIVFTLRHIPRGRGKAPKVVTPNQIRTADELQHQLALAKTKIELIKNLPKNSHFKHPYFGVLNRRNTLRFLLIHTQHHLKIIKDIIKD